MRRLLPFTATALLTALASCNSSPLPVETFIGDSITGSTSAPAWVEGSIPNDGSHVRFVGRGGGFDVLDERAAFDEAMGHALAQLSGYISTRVVAEACATDSSLGARFLQPGSDQSGSGERVDQSLRSCVHSISEAVVGGLAATDQYWERWEVQTKFSNRHGANRWKCWVLCEVSNADIDLYVEAALAAVRNEVALREAQEELAQRKLDEVKLIADAQLAAADLEEARARLAEEVHHNRLLSERIYYGRRFRLIQDEDCLHYPGTCSHQADHPAWRTTDVVVSREAVPIPVELEDHEDDDDSGCLESSGCDEGE